MTSMFNRNLRTEAQTRPSASNSLANLIGMAVGLTIVAVAETSLKPSVTPPARILPENPNVAELKALRREIEDARDLLKRVDIRDYWVRSAVRSVDHMLNRAQAAVDRARPESMMFSMHRDTILEYLREAQRELRNIESGN